MSTVLPSEHRRLRHVVQFACRHVPVLPPPSGGRHPNKGSCAAGAATMFTLRHVAPSGGPGEVIYESEVVEGSVHPVWRAMPLEVTEASCPTVRRAVFSLYKVEKAAPHHNHHHHNHAAQKSAVAAARTVSPDAPVAVEPPTSPTTEATGEGSSQMAQSPAPTDEEGLNNSSAMDLMPDATIAMVRRGSQAVTETGTKGSTDDADADVGMGEDDDAMDGVRSYGAEDGNAGPDAVAEGGAVAEHATIRPSPPTAVATGSANNEAGGDNGVPQAGAEQKVGNKPLANPCSDPAMDALASSSFNQHPHHHRKLIFEFLIDFTRTEFVARHLSALQDVSHIPAHIEDGHRSFSVLVKCRDGVFFPTMDGGAASTDFDLSKPTPSINYFPKLQATSAQVGASTFLQTNLDADWDLVDGEAAREAEARQQKADNISFGDIKALASTSIALRRLQQSLTMCIDERRTLLDSMLTDERNGVVLQSVQQAATAVTVATCARLSGDREREIERLRGELAQRREALVQRAALMEEKNAALRSSPTEASADFVKESVARREALRDALNSTRRSHVQQMAELFPLSSSLGTICGAKLPAPEGALPDTAEHALAIGHVCHAIVVFTRIYGMALPHPIHLSPGRCRIYERQGAPEDKAYPLFPVKNSERPMLRRGMDLLRQDVVSAAYQIHHQRQAEGLPLIMAVEKLLLGR